MDRQNGAEVADPQLSKSDFVNIDGRVRCPTPDCWGDLVMMPTGRQDDEGIPEFLPYTACPLCMTSYEIRQDMADRDLYLRVSWMRANPGAADPGSGPLGGAA